MLTNRGRFIGWRAPSSTSPCTSIRWTLPPVLLLPVVTSAVEGVLADSKTVSQMLGQPFWLEYAARAGALLLLAALISLSVLRSREHEADLRSVHGMSAAPLQALLSRWPDRKHSVIP